MYWFWNIPGIVFNILGLYKQSKIEVQIEANPETIHTWFIILSLFHCGPSFVWHLMIQVSYSIYDNPWNPNLLTRIISPIWINTIGPLLLVTVYDYPVLTTMLLLYINYISSTYIVVPFILVPKILPRPETIKKRLCKVRQGTC